MYIYMLTVVSSSYTVARQESYVELHITLSL